MSQRDRTVLGLLLAAVFVCALFAIVALGQPSAEPAPSAVVTAKRFTPEHVDRHLDCKPHTYAGGRHVVLCDWRNVPVADRYQLRVDGRWLAVSRATYEAASIGATR